MNIICYVSLAIWNIPVGWKWTCFILAGCGGGLSGLIMAWGHEICSDDNEERALVIGTMNEMAYVFQAWLPLIVWQQIDAPEYHKGYVAVSILSAILIIGTFVTRSLHHSQIRRASSTEAVEDDSVSEGVEDVKVGDRKNTLDSPS